VSYINIEKVIIMKKTREITVVYVLTIAITAGVFIFDLLTPVGYAVWLGYLLPLIIASWKLQRWFIYTLASVCTAFIALGFIYSFIVIKSEIALFNPKMALLNRFLAVFTLWVATILLAERKLAEEQIQEQATFLDSVQEAIEVRNLGHRLIYWNKGAQRLYGWTKEEAIGKNANRLLYKEESPMLIEAKKSIIEKSEWIGELHQVTKDKKEIIVESHWSLIRDNEGKPKSILIINTDITEKKKLESQLLRAQRMESIGTLAGSMAHDLNNWHWTWSFHCSWNCEKPWRIY
jgi:PAS domain S-box-containing protein